MPTGQMTEESRWKLPEDVLFPARLMKVDERRIDYTIKEGHERAGERDFFFKWEWEFEITDGEYTGLKAWGSTEAKITTENNVRQWSEALLRKQFELGEGINTDDMLGLPCVITVKNETYPKKDGTTGYRCPVLDIFPEGADKGIASIDSSAPTAAVTDPNDPWAGRQSQDPPY